MTTKIITPQEVTLDMLRAGVECNETPGSYPSKFQLVDGAILYSVKYPGFAGWSAIELLQFEEVSEYMAGDSTDNTIWTTPIQETA